MLLAKRTSLKGIMDKYLLTFSSILVKNLSQKLFVKAINCSSSKYRFDRKQGYYCFEFITIDIIINLFSQS